MNAQTSSTDGLHPMHHEPPKFPYAVYSRKHVPLGPTHETAESAYAWKQANYPGARVVDLRTGKTIRAADVERADALDLLRGIVSPGDTITCVLRHVARSGMTRHIDFYKLNADGERWLSSIIGRILGYRLSDRDALVVGGCGMDMGFHVVYSVSRNLYPDGFACIVPEGLDDDGAYSQKTRCPSNDHTNARTWGHMPGMHSDGGYALLHKWL